MDNIVKGVLSLPFTILGGLVTTLVHGPTPKKGGSGSTFKKGAATWQDHGLFCDTCKKKRWCRVN